MKRVLIALLAMTVFVFTGCSGGEERTYRTVKEIQESGVLVASLIGADGKYVIEDNGDYAGIEVEILKKTAELLGVQIEFVRGFDQNAFLAQEIDLAAGMIDPVDSMLSVESSYSTGAEVTFIVTRYGETCDRLALLESKNVGYVAGTIVSAFVSNKLLDVTDNTIFNEFPTYNDALAALYTYDIAALLCPQSDVDNILAGNDGKIVATYSTDTPSFSFSIIAPVGSTEVIGWVNHAMNELSIEKELSTENDESTESE